jgi:hypothetical protein
LKRFAIKLGKSFANEAIVLWRLGSQLANLRDSIFSIQRAEALINRRY